MSKVQEQQELMINGNTKIMLGKYKIYIVIVIIFYYFNKPIVAQDTRGIYAEVMYITNNGRLIKSGEYLLNSDELAILLDNPDTVWMYPFKHLISFSSRTIESLKINLPDSIASIKHSNQKSFADLYRGNDANPYSIVQSRKNKKYYFYFKTVNVTLKKIGSEAELKKIAKSIFVLGCPDCPYLPFIDNYWVIRVLSQEPFTKNDLSFTNCSDKTKKISKKYARRKFKIYN